MSDFDKFFAERLNEEEPFPKQEKNWRALSKRLDAFDAGLGGSSRQIRYWQAAAAVMLLGASVLFGKVWTMHQELGALREEVAALHRQLPVAREDQPNPTPVAPLPATPQPSQLTPREMRVQQTPSAVAESETPLPGGQMKNPQTRHLQPLQAQESHANTARPATERNQQTGNATLSSTSNPTQSPIDPTVTKNNQPTGTLEPEQPVQQDALTKNNQPTGIQTPEQPVQQDALGAATDSKHRPDALEPLTTEWATALEGPAKRRPEIPEVPAFTRPVPIIKPVPRLASKFRVGLEGVVGIPQTKAKGVTVQRGVGVSAEMTLWRDLRLSASADWMRHEVKSDIYLDHFHIPPKDSMKLPPDKEFVRVEGSQRSQQYSIGLSYTVPVRFWVRPAVRVAHSWIHLPAELYTFQYEEKDPHNPPNHHDPFYFPKRSEAGWLNNNWRLGLGLEHDTPVWTVSVWADYSKNLKSKESLFDALYLRAGVQYRFD